MKYLSQRNGCYWLRIKPSIELLPYLPIQTKEYLCSLGRVSLAEAERKAHPILSKWLNEISTAKQLASNNDNSITDESIRELLKRDDINDEVIDKLEQWRSESYGDPYSNEPSPEFHVKDEMLKGSNRAVLPYFYLDEYQHSLRHLKPKTVTQRISRLKTQFFPKFEYLSADSLKTVNIQRWVDSYTTMDNPPAFKTMKGYLSAARDYVGWLRRNGYLNIEDTFDAVKLPPKKQLTKGIVRKSFSDHELQTILHNMKNNELKAITYLAMYTGCRIEELARLKVDDIKEVENRYIIDIVDAKTEAGIRAIPVHKNIETILIERLVYKDYIFPKASANTVGTRSDAFSKQFGRLKTKLGFGKDKVFHSIRKTVSTKLEQAGISEGIAADLLGHEKETISYGLYSSGSSLESKIKAIDSIKYNLN